MRIAVAALVVAFSAAGFSQPVTAGVGLIGGASLTQDFQNQIFDVGFAYSTPKRWITGGMVEARFPKHLAVEVDALYHELRFTDASILPNGTPNSGSPAPVVTWEFPVLVKYRLPLPKLTPLVEAGPAFRSSGNLNGTRPSNHGFTAGLGVEVRAKRVRIAPQVRYIRWARDRRVFSAAPLTVPDQVQFLTSISF